MRPTLSMRRAANASNVRRERGVVLMVVMFLLVILGLAAASTMRGAAQTERNVQGARAHAQALQYAQAALRSCERQVGLQGQTVAGAVVNTIRVPPAAADAEGRVTNWQRPGTWWAGGAPVAATQVPEAELRSDIAGITEASVLPPRPQCIAECVQLPNPAAGIAVGATPADICMAANLAVVITARGFSADFVGDANGSPSEGTSVWVQSTARR